MSFADYRELYRQKLTTADEAVKIIKSGDWVDYGFCAIQPRVLDEALARRAPELEDVKVRGGISLWKPAIFDIEDPARHIIFNSHHMSGVERHYIASGAGFYEPMRYSELPRYYYDHITPPDVAMFQVTPMDSHGYFNFGLSASHVRAVCEKAKVVIVEGNENMPRCLGGFDNTIHISEVDMVVEGRNDPLGIQPSGEADDVDKAVARLIVEQIPDGACLQLGIGGMPNTVGAMLCQSDLKDLGVHTEMYVDAYVDLAMAGRSPAPVRISTAAVRSTLSPPVPRSSTTIWTTTTPAWPRLSAIPTMCAPTRQSTTLSQSTMRRMWTSTVRATARRRVPARAAAPAASRTSCWVRICPMAAKASSACLPPIRIRTAQ